MEQRIYHGNINPADLSRNLYAHFNKGNLRVSQIGKGDLVTVQIATRNHPSAGGQTALSIRLQKVDDGVLIQISKQSFLGVAASLGVTALSAFRNPFNLIHRLDDLAQDIEYLQLSEEVWNVIDDTARSMGTGHQLSLRLRRYICDYCNTPNKVGEPRCIACGAPLGNIQPETCNNCGFILSPDQNICPNCRSPI